MWTASGLPLPTALRSDMRRVVGANGSVHEVFGFNVEPGPTCLFTAALLMC